MLRSMGRYAARAFIPAHIPQSNNADDWPDYGCMLSLSKRILLWPEPFFLDMASGVSVHFMAASTDILALPRTYFLFSYGLLDRRTSRRIGTPGKS